MVAFVMYVRIILCVTLSNEIFAESKSPANSGTTITLYPTWALQHRYDSDELIRMGQNESSAKEAFALLSAKRQHEKYQMQHANDQMQLQIKDLMAELQAMSRTSLFYQCCCAALLFGNTLDRLERLFVAKSYSTKPKKEANYLVSGRYNQCIDFMAEEKMYPEDHFSEEEIKDAKQFRRNLLASLNINENKTELLKELVHPFCYSHWKKYKIRNDITHNVEVVMGLYKKFAKEPLYQVRWDTFHCTALRTADEEFILDNTDVYFLNAMSKAARFLFRTDVQFVLLENNGLASPTCELPGAAASYLSPM